VLDVDLAGRAVHVRQAYRHPKAIRSAAMGSVRLLPGGQALVGWGDQPYASEFSPDGTLAVDAVLPRGQQSYRSFRLPWAGVPQERPAIAARRDRRTGDATLYVSWNGATDVASWLLSTGPRAGRRTPVAIFPRRGFETEIALGALEGHVLATALDASGRRLASSRALRV
jgi:hypothetical protein